MLDEHGAAHAGGEAGLMREMTASGSIGFGLLEAASGTSIQEFLTRFGIALWADGRSGNWITSWNLYDIFQGLTANARLQPYTSSLPEPSLDVSVRAGSTGTPAARPAHLGHGPL